jgi:hypothetical protein
VNANINITYATINYVCHMCLLDLRFNTRRKKWSAYAASAGEGWAWGFRMTLMHLWDE